MHKFKIGDMVMINQERTVELSDFDINRGLSFEKAYRVDASYPNTISLEGIHWYFLHEGFILADMASINLEILQEIL